MHTYLCVCVKSMVYLVDKIFCKMGDDHHKKDGDKGAKEEE